MLFGLQDIRMRRQFIDQEGAGEDRKRREHQRLRAEPQVVGGARVDHAGRLVLDRRVERIEAQLFVRIERGQVVEIDPVADRFGIVVVDADQLGDREIAFAILGRADLALDRVAGAQAPFADLVGRNVDIVRPGEVVRLGAAQEAEAVGQHFQHAVAEHLLAGLGALLHDREHQLLLAQARDVLDLQGFAHLDQLRDVLGFQFGQVHGSGLAGHRAWCRPRVAATGRREARVARRAPVGGDALEAADRILEDRSARGVRRPGGWRSAR